MAIRLQDIANDLNLSKMTISKVLRGQTDVSAETKARVLKRMKELNYRPNISARGLRTGQTYSVGLVVPMLGVHSTAQIVRGINEVFRPANYSLVISSADGDAEIEEDEVELHLARQVDALVIVPRSEASEMPQVLKTTTVPVIYAGAPPPRFVGLSVGLREREVGEMAAQHLLNRRCKRIAYLRGPRTPVADQRFGGFLETLRDAGVIVRQEWVAETQPGEGDYGSGVAAIKRWHASKIKPDGVATYTDLLAAGARDAALEAQMKIPRTLQVIGCGNVFEVCETRVSITSIDLACEELGRRVARLALKCIGERSDSSLRGAMFSPRVVQRMSTRTI